MFEGKPFSHFRRSAAASASSAGTGQNDSLAPNPATPQQAGEEPGPVHAGDPELMQAGGAATRADALNPTSPPKDQPKTDAAAQKPGRKPAKPSATPRRRPARLGVALGGGAARGWAHIGVMRVLNDAGFMPDVIVGTSIGAVVGGCCATKSLDVLEEFATSLTRRRVMGLMDLSIGGSGLISGNRLRHLLEQDIGRLRIEDIPTRFAAVATELGSGHEIWLTRGPVVDAMRASYALPGIFDPVQIGGRWLMDGALVNPIPVTVARALGAEVVLAVNLNGDLRSNRASTIPSHGPLEDDIADAVPTTQDGRQGGILGALGALGAARRIGRFARKPDGAPGIGTVMMDAFNITQDRISRSRLAGDPPNLMISPRLGKVGLFDFHRAAEAIKLGAEAAERALPELEELLQMADVPT